MKKVVDIGDWVAYNAPQSRKRRLFKRSLVVIIQ